METEDRVARRFTRVRAPSIGVEPVLDVKKLLRSLQAVRDGDFSVRLPSDRVGMAGKIADTFNDIVSANQRMVREMERAGRLVGKEGRTRHRVAMDRRPGAWGEMEASLNTLMDDLLWPTTEVTRTIAEVSTAIAREDLSRKITVDVKGEILQLKETINTMVDQLNSANSTA